MNRRSRTLTFCLTGLLASLIGFLASLILVGAVLAAERRALLQTTTTSYTPLSGGVKWEGDWEISELGADPSEVGSQAGTDRVTIPFVGTDFGLRVRRGGYRGNFFISVDGKPANQLPWEERGAYLVLTSPDYGPQLVTIPVASGLADGPHQAVIVADRGWDQWPLVGWSVSCTPDTTVYRWAMAALGALGFVCLAGVIWGIKETSLRLQGQGDKETREQGEGVAVRNSQSLISTPHALPSLLVATAVFYFSPWLPLTLVSGLALAVIIFLRLDTGLALVAAMAPFYLHPRLLFG